MLNLNYNINQAGGRGNCRGEVKFNYSASIVVAAGGAGGSTGDGNGIGGGGGGGMAVTQSISIIPNLTYQINVGAGGAVNANGQDSYLIGWDDNDTIPISFLASGGKIGLFPGAGIVNGGDSGTGSLVRAGVVTQYPKFNGGTGSYSSGGGFGAAIAGGGRASNQANGANGTTSGGTQARGGNGASGVTAGGGGGATAGGPTPPPDSINGIQGTASSTYSVGGNGVGINPVRAASAGSDGTVIISYAGQPKAIVTNATTTNDGYGNTVHTFASGSGTFLYTIPYPWTDVVPYTVEVCPPTTQPPFAPYGRADEYSASLVLAIPGAIFKNGYNNVFNQISEFDDISGYLKGGAVLNPNTGRYTPAYASHTLTPTGSVGFITGSLTINNFSGSGYNTSLIVSGNNALNVIPLTGSLGTDFNFSKNSPWCIETWVAYNITASSVTTDSTSAGVPNKQWIGNWFNSATGSFEAMLGYSGKVEGYLTGAPYNTASAVPAFFWGNVIGNNPDYFYKPTYNNTIVPYEWQHTAITCYPSASVGLLQFYINGQRIGSTTITTEILPTSSLYPRILTILGNANPPQPPPYNDISNSNYKTGSGLYIQDMRVYNGAAKYTGSSFTPPLSMIVGQNEPYPQYT